MTSQVAFRMTGGTSGELSTPQPTVSTLPSDGGTGIQSDQFDISRSNPSADRDDHQLDTSVGNRKLASTLPRLTYANRSQVSSVQLLAEWSGCVTSVPSSDPYFSATLIGLIGEGVKGEEEDATIPVSDVSEGDKDLLRPGNFFRLCVIHEVLPSGQPRRSTQVVFRRLPAYRQHDLNQAEERGREIARGLRVE